MTADRTGPASAGHAAVEDVGSLIIVGYVGQVVTLVLSIALRHVLSPAEVGSIAVLGLAATYSPYLALGALQAGERLIALEIGREDLAQAARLEASTGAIAVLASVVLLLLGVVAGLAFRPQSSTGLVASAVVLIVVVQQFTSIAVIRLRTRLRFRTIAAVTLAGSVFVASFGLVGAALAGVSGAVIGSVTGYAASGALAVRLSRVRFGRPARDTLRAIVTQAPGFLAMGATTAMLYTIDQVIVGTSLGAAAFGVYSSAYLGNAFLVRIPANVSAAIFPRLQISAGRGVDAGTLVRQVDRASGISAIVATPLVVAAIVAFPLVFVVFLPAYLESITPMRLVLLAVLGLVLAGPASQLLVASGRAWRVVTTTLVAALSIALGSLVAIWLGALSVAGVALVDCGAYLAFGIAMQLAIDRPSPGRFGSLVGMTYLPAIVAVVVATLAPTGAPVLDAAVAFVASAAAWGLMLLLAWRIRPELRSDVVLVRAVVARLPGAVSRLLRRARR